MKSIRFHTGFVAAMAILMAGCAPKPSVVVLPSAHPREALAHRLQERADFWHGYQARINIRGESAKKTFNFQAVIVANLPDQLRFEAGKLGQTAGVLVFDHHSSSLWIPSENTHFTASRGETLVEHFLGVAIPPEVFSGSLIAALSQDQLKHLQLLPDQPTPTLLSREPDAEIAFVWRLTPDFQSMESAFVHGGSRSYSIVYDPPVSLDPQVVPRNVKLVSAQWQLEIKIDQMVPMKDPPASIFQLPLPEGTRTVDLARVK